MTDQQLSSLVSAVRPGTGLLVVGHGTGDPAGAEETRTIARAAAAMLPGVPVELGFLEVIGPTIAEAVGTLASRGCSRIVAAPLLLFTAGHARRDVPEALTAATGERGIAWSQCASFGRHPEIVALSRQRRREALAGLQPVPQGETLLVIVGRGSSDPAAPAHLREFALATLAADDVPPERLRLAFVAAARPTLAEAIEAASDPSAGRVRRIVVQPHLLFRGHVEDQVTAAVDAARLARPDLEWIQPARLGAEPPVARALIDRFVEALAASEPAGGGPPRQDGRKSSQ